MRETSVREAWGMRLANKTIRALSDFTNVGELHDAARNVPDGACALISGAYLQNELRLIVTERLRPEAKLHKELFDYPGPLSTFSATIQMAYALEIIGPVTRSDLDRIRDLRNAFAHSPLHLTFDQKDISESVDQLQIFARRKMNKENLRETAQLLRVPLARQVFFTSVQLLVNALKMIRANKQHEPISTFARPLLSA